MINANNYPVEEFDVETEGTDEFLVSDEDYITDEIASDSEEELDEGDFKRLSANISSCTKLRYANNWNAAEPTIMR